MICKRLGIESWGAFGVNYTESPKVRWLELGMAFC